MALSRISTYAVHQATLRDSSLVQQRLTELQKQISSGLKSDNFEGLNGQVEQFAALEQKIGKAESYIRNNNVALTRINSTNTALDQIVQTATELKNAILLRRNESSGADLGFPERMNGFWRSMTSQLNTNIEGRYLFSGTSTNTKAVDDEIYPTLAVDGVPDDGYYLGSRDDVTSRAQDNFDGIFNVRADDDGFQQIFAGLAMAQEGNVSGNKETLQRAYDFVQQGIQNVIAVQASVNSNKVAIEQANERHDALRLYWKGVKEDIINTDFVTASTEVAVNQGVLQASFQAFSRINTLRLSDYLQ